MNEFGTGCGIRHTSLTACLFALTNCVPIEVGSKIDSRTGLVRTRARFVILSMDDDQPHHRLLSHFDLVRHHGIAKWRRERGAEPSSASQAIRPASPSSSFDAERPRILSPRAGRGGGRRHEERRSRRRPRTTAQFEVRNGGPVVGRRHDPTEESFVVETRSSAPAFNTTAGLNGGGSSYVV
jgi:hypothetical protein